MTYIESVFVGIHIIIAARMISMSMKSFQPIVLLTGTQINFIAKLHMTYIESVFVGVHIFLDNIMVIRYTHIPIGRID